MQFPNYKINSQVADNTLSKPQTKPLSEDKFVDFIYKKSEKIGNAIYMISNFFPDQEPLKWTLRDAGLRLFNQGVFLASPGRVVHEDTLALVRIITSEIVSKLQMAFFSGLLSEMNFLIFKRELEAFLSAIDSRLDPSVTSGGSVLSESFFRLPEADETTANRGPVYKGQMIKDTSNRISGQRDFLKDISRDVPPLTSRSSNRNSRQTSIIGFLKRVKDASVKDFIDLIKNCSEKTIQRELLGLVRKGVLKKTGNRRWSRYSLVT